MEDSNTTSYQKERIELSCHYYKRALNGALYYCSAKDYPLSQNFLCSRNHPDYPSEYKRKNGSDETDEHKLAESSHPNAVCEILQNYHQQHVEDVGAIGLSGAPFPELVVMIAI